MKFVLLFAIFALLGVAVLSVADFIGFNTKFPRGFLLLTLLDLAAIKGVLLIYVIRELTK